MQKQKIDCVRESFHKLVSYYETETSTFPECSNFPGSKLIVNVSISWWWNRKEILADDKERRKTYLLPEINRKYMYSQRTTNVKEYNSVSLQ